jgi:hypothetical protein
MVAEVRKSLTLEFSNTVVFCFLHRICNFVSNKAQEHTLSNLSKMVA